MSREAAAGAEGGKTAKRMRGRGVLVSPQRWAISRELAVYAADVQAEKEQLQAALKERQKQVCCSSAAAMLPDMKLCRLWMRLSCRVLC